MSSFYEWTVEPFTWHTVKNGLYVIDNDFSIKFRDEHKQWFSFLILKDAKTDGGGGGSYMDQKLTIINIMLR